MASRKREAESPETAAPPEQSRRPEAPTADAGPLGPEPEPAGEAPNEGPAGEGASSDDTPPPPAPPDPPEEQPKPMATERTIRRLLGVAKQLGHGEDDLAALERESSKRSEEECLKMLEEGQAILKQRQQADAKRAERERQRSEREAHAEYKAKLAKLGKVLCRAKKTCLAGMAYYAGQEFTLNAEEAKRREKRGELEIL